MAEKGKTNIFFWFGNDDFTMLERLQAEKRALSESNLHADISDFDFADASSRFELEQRIRTALRGNSLFSADKLTVVRNFWTTQRKSKKGAETEEGGTEGKKNDFENFLLESLTKLGGADRLYLLEERDLLKRGKASKRLEELQKEGRLRREEFVLPLGFKFNVWLEERCKARGGKIDRESLELLALLLGRGMEQKERSGEVIAAYDLHQAANEIDKLIAYADGAPIRKEDIQLLISASSDMNIFNLIESIGGHDRNRALALLSGQIKMGFNENYILTMLVYHFRNLILIKSLLEEGMGASQIAARTRMHPLVVDKSIRYARNLKPEQLRLIYDKLYGADASIKTGRMEPELALDLLVAAI